MDGDGWQDGWTMGGAGRKDGWMNIPRHPSICDYPKVMPERDGETVRDMCYALGVHLLQ